VAGDTRSVVASSRSEEQEIDREMRLRSKRFLHVGVTDEGMVSIRGELAPIEGAAMRSALDKTAKAIFDRARKAGLRESHDAYLADALAELCRGGVRKEGVPSAEIILTVSAEALQRGELKPGDCCEIAGVGPVSLSAVEYLFGAAWAKAVITKGVDVLSVTHLSRAIPAHLATALDVRDKICAVPGCGVSWGLERDHIIGVENQGPTELANLVKLCALCGIPHNVHKGYPLRSTTRTPALVMMDRCHNGASTTRGPGRSSFGGSRTTALAWSTSSDCDGRTASSAQSVRARGAGAVRVNAGCVQGADVRPR
jgi:hypothetical protein